MNGFVWDKQSRELNLKQRIKKHKSYGFYPQNSFCKKGSEHLRDCSRMKEPFFRIYPFLYENKKELREFKEKHNEMETTVEYFVEVFFQ